MIMGGRSNISYEISRVAGGILHFYVPVLSKGRFGGNGGV